MSETKDLVRQNTAVTVLELMFSGKTKAEACKTAGITERTFDNIISAFPELTESFSVLIRARLMQFSENLSQQRVENTKSISTFMESLREIMEDDEEELNVRVKAFNSLVKADKHAAAIFKYLLPAAPPTKETDPEPGVTIPDAAKIAGAEIMKSFEGANLREIKITATIENDRDVIDIEATNDFDTPDDIPSQSDPEK